MAYTKNLISRAEAKRTHANWVEFAKTKLGFDATTAPRSIQIPIIDILNLERLFKDHIDQKLSGIRIYLTRKENIMDKPDGLQLTCFVVPTVEVEKDGYKTHHDHIVNIPKEVEMVLAMPGPDGGDGGEGGGESIYDMTHPCPPYCGGNDDSFNP